MPPLIGTAGWSIPASERSSFPNEGTTLERYAAVMPSVEVNTSFYRPHRRQTWERWAASTPDDFRFSVKMPKEISHVRRLIDVIDPLDRFMDEVGGLEGKLDILLLQLPPSFAFDRATVTEFLVEASSRTHASIVCEPRHASWFSSDVDALLVDLRVARVAADPARFPDAALPGGWRGVSYLRLHGSPEMYRSTYGEARLRAYAEMLAADLEKGRPTWCIFDNTASFAALGDAVCLKRIMEERL